ncbi:hypothetical protein AB0346_27160 [Nocardia beijingensis]|uniref:hypothetical protein n=1 Tax=Nocardia beijingensis TaxID=95162 RepID=UPI001895BAF8|nr:hypothetical protein [Nocardia beijingensis]MBF6078281.1 hypothetical protein [Nocardia beijingensis]
MRSPAAERYEDFMPTITLTQDNFDSVVTSHPIVLVDWWAGLAPTAPRYGWPGL